jgi:hypothetical protein
MGYMVDPVSDPWAAYLKGERGEDGLITPEAARAFLANTQPVAEPDPEEAKVEPDADEVEATEDALFDGPAVAPVFGVGPNDPVKTVKEAEQDTAAKLADAKAAIEAEREANAKAWHMPEEKRRKPPSGYARRVRRLQRSREVLKMYSEGQTLAFVALVLQTSEQRAASLLAYGLSQLPKTEAVDRRAQIEVRLDVAASGFADKLHHKDPNIAVRAADGLRQTEADRARLLGLNLEGSDQ